MFKAIMGGTIAAIALLFSGAAMATCTPPANGTTADAVGLNTYLTCQFAPLSNPSFAGTVTASSDIYANGTYYYGGGKAMFQYSDSWLRLNPTGAFTSGIYAGSGIFRTDGNLQVGSAGGSFNVTSGGVVSAAGGATFGGNLTLSPANPYITSGGSYIVIPNGLYVLGGTLYSQAPIEARSGIGDDTAAYLTIAGGTGGISYFSGNVGVGTTSPAYPLTVAGVIETTGAGSNVVASGGSLLWGDASTGGSTLCYVSGFGLYAARPCTSLSQYKNNQKTLGLGLDTLMQLHPVEFDWDKQHGGRHDLGFIAQEVEKVNPLLAEYDYKDDAEGKLIGVKYMQMTALITEAVQQLKTENDARAVRNGSAQKTVTDKIAALEAQDSQLRAENERLKTSSEHLQTELSDQQTQIAVLKRMIQAQVSAVGRVGSSLHPSNSTWRAQSAQLERRVNTEN
jgi:hypothetical protein